MIEIPTKSQRAELVRQALSRHPNLSDRAIAAKTGCSREMVKRVRASLPTWLPQQAKLTGRDGRQYPYCRRRKPINPIASLQAKCDRLLRELESELASESFRSAPESVLRKFSVSVFHLNRRADQLRRMAREAV